ncbi:hypothetical protein, partial [Pantoea allii]|uniref:hypothetical protein n=1 Tax=Pantoea allii TaxID=574096 RepID=UPI001ABFBFCC
GVRQPSLSLRHSLRPDGPSGCALRGAAVLVAASLPRRPGLRSLLSAPDASSKPPPVRAYSLVDAGLPVGGAMSFFSGVFCLQGSGDTVLH